MPKLTYVDESSDIKINVYICKAEILNCETLFPNNLIVRQQRQIDYAGTFPTHIPLLITFWIIRAILKAYRLRSRRVMCEDA